MTQYSIHRVKRCADCGERFSGPEDRQYCRDCMFKHGEIWILDMKMDKWIRESRP